MVKSKKKISQILNEIKNKEDNNGVLDNWRFQSLEKFIVSFEKKTLKENKDIAKRYGNIAKKITNEILENDIGPINLETGEKFSDEKILSLIKENNFLNEKFNSLYFEIIKRNYWKLKTPFLSEKVEIGLDRLQNDFDRFEQIYNFYVEKKPIAIKNTKNNNKKNIEFKDLSPIEQKEVEKIFYILLSRIYRKTKGIEFLKKFGQTINNNKIYKK